MLSLFSFYSSSIDNRKVLGSILKFYEVFSYNQTFVLFIIKPLVKNHCTEPQASSSTVNARHPQAIRPQRHLPSPTAPAYSAPVPQGSI